MDMQVEKTKNSTNNFMFVFIIIFVIVIAIVFFSFRKSNVLEVAKIDIGKVINKDTKELDRIGQNLDRDIDLIVNNPKFYQLTPHNDISLEFEVGRENPFQSF